jgi:hypothetical protein
MFLRYRDSRVTDDFPDSAMIAFRHRKPYKLSLPANKLRTCSTLTMVHRTAVNPQVWLPQKYYRRHPRLQAFFLACQLIHWMTSFPFLAELGAQMPGNRTRWEYIRMVGVGSDLQCHLCHHIPPAVSDRQLPCHLFRSHRRTFWDFSSHVVYGDVSLLWISYFQTLANYSETVWCKIGKFEMNR